MHTQNVCQFQKGKILIKTITNVNMVIIPIFQKLENFLKILIVLRKCYPQDNTCDKMSSDILSQYSKIEFASLSENFAPFHEYFFFFFLLRPLLRLKLWVNYVMEYFSVGTTVKDCLTV